MPRKTPVLLRRGPLSGRVLALTNYRHAGGRIVVATDGKHDVTAEFRHLMLDELFPRAKESALFTSALDGAAKGMELDKRERASLSRFWLRLAKLIEQDSEWLKAGQPHEL